MTRILDPFTGKKVPHGPRHTPWMDEPELLRWRAHIRMRWSQKQDKIVPVRRELNSVDLLRTSIIPGISRFRSRSPRLRLRRALRDRLSYVHPLSGTL